MPRNDAEMKLLARAHDEAVDAVALTQGMKFQIADGHWPTVDQAEKLRDKLTGALCAAQEFENRARGLPAPKVGP